MAGQSLGAMYMTIGGKDDISQLLDKIEKKLQKINQQTGEIGLIPNRNFDYARQKFAELSKMQHELQNKMESRMMLNMDTSSIKREMQSIEEAAVKLMNFVNSTINGKQFLQLDFADKGKGDGKIEGVKTRIDEITQTVLGAGRATSQLATQVNSDMNSVGKAFDRANELANRLGITVRGMNGMKMDSINADRLYRMIHDYQAALRNMRDNKFFDKEMFDRISKGMALINKWTPSIEKRLNDAINGKQNGNNTNKEETNLARQGHLVESLAIAYSRLGYAIKDVSNAQSKTSSKFLINNGEKLLSDLRDYQQAILAGYAKAKAGDMKKPELIKLLGASYIDLYDRRRNYEKDVTVEQRYGKEQKRAEDREWRELVKQDTKEQKALEELHNARQKYNDKAEKEAKRAAEKQLREMRQVQNAVLKSAESYEVARARILRYTDAIDRTISRFENLKATGNLSAATTGLIDNRIQALRDQKDLWTMIRDDQKMATSRVDMAQALASHVNELGLSKDLRTIANKEANQNKADAKRAVSDAKKIDEAYGKAITSISKKYNELRDTESKLRASISKNSKLGLDTSSMQRDLTALKRLEKDYLSLLNMNKITKEQLVRSDQYGTILGRMSVQSGSLMRKIRTDMSSASTEVKKFGNEFMNVVKASTRETSRLGAAWGELKNQFMMFGAGFGLQQMFHSIVQTGGEIEKQHIALRSIIGDLQNADQLFGQIKGLALRSPFTFGELNRDVKQLAAYGVEYKNIYDTTRRLADISSGLGVSFERIALAYGQVKSRSWLDGKELRQFAYAGIPLMEKLAEMYSRTTGKNVSQAQVRKMISNREVSFEDVQSILWEMTDEGGKFFNMQDTLSQTLYGRYNKLIDAWEIMLSKFASGDNIIGGTLMKILDLTTNIVQVFDKALPLIATFFSMFTVRKIGGAIFGAIGGDKLNAMQMAKNQIADTARRQVLAGQQLSPIYKDILATQNRIVAADIQRLRLAGAITAQEARHLTLVNNLKMSYLRMLATIRYRTNHSIGKAMYDSLISGISSITSRIGMIFAPIGRKISGFIPSMVKTMFGSITSLIGLGLKGIGQGIMAFFGGPVGLLLTGGFMSAMLLKERADENKRIANQIYDSIEDRHKRTEKFLEDHPLKASIDKKELDNLRKEYKEFYGDIYGEEFDRADLSGEDELKTLRDRLETLNEAQRIAANLSSVFANAQMSTDWALIPDDSVIDDINDYAKAYQNLITASKGERPTKVSDFILDANELNDELSTMANTLTRKLQTVDKKHRSAVYKILRDAWVSSIEGLTPDVESAVKIMLDKQMGKMANADVEFAKLTANKAGGALKKIIEEGVSQGQSYEDIAKGKAKDSIKAALEQIGRDMPQFAKDVRRLLEDEQFRIKVMLQVGDETVENGVRKLFVNRLMGRYANNANDEYMRRWRLIQKYTKEDSHTDTKKSAHDDLENKKKDLAAAKQANDTKERIAELQQAYDDALYVWKLMGYKDDFKKGSGNKKDRQLEEWKRLFDLLKQVNTEYEKYVNIYDKEETLKRLDKMGDFTDLEKFLKNGKEDVKIDFSNYAKLAEDFYKLTVDMIPKTAPEARLKYLQQVQKYYLEMALKNEEQIAKHRAELRSREIDEEQKRWERFQSLMVNLGDSRAADFALDENDIKTYFKKVPIGGENKIEDTKELTKEQKADELRKSIDEKRAQYAEKMSRLASLSGKERDKVENEAEELMKTIGEITKELFDVLSGKDNSLGNVNVKGFKKVLTMDREEILRTAIEEIAKNSGVDKSVEELRNAKEEDLKAWFKYEPLEELKKRLEQLKAETEKRKNDAVQIVNDLYAATKNEGLIEAKIKKDAEERKKKLGSHKDDFILPGVTLSDVIDRDADDKILKSSIEYANFFRTAVVKSFDKAKDSFNKIMKNLDDNLKAGLISKSEYVSEVRKATDQLNKMKYNSDNLFGSNSDFAVFMKKGINGLLENAKNESDKALAEHGKDSKEYKEATKAEEKLRNFANGLNTASDALAIATGIFDGLTKASKSLSDMFYAIGDKGLGDAWSDVSDTISGMASVLAPANNILGSALKGDVSGIVGSALSAPVELVTGPVTAFAKLADKKRDRTIQELKLANQNLQNMEANLRRALERALGGLYNKDNAGVYTALKDNMQKQLQNMQRQREEEAGKKKSDEGALLEYDRQIAELRDKVNHYTEDIAKELYSIDFKGWAGQLANALVNAWASGASAAREYKKTVGEILKGVATSVIQQKYIESALEPIMQQFMADFDLNGGKMTDDGILLLRKMMYIAEDMTNKTYNMLDSIEDGVRADGGSMRDNATGVSPSIAGVTEDTADLLASYINNIRLDSSQKLMLQRQIADDVMAIRSYITGPSVNNARGMGGVNPDTLAYMNELNASMDANATAISRLASEQIPAISNQLAVMVADLKAIEVNTGRSATASESINEILDSLTNGTGRRKLSIAVG